MNPLKKLAGQTAIYGLPTIVGRLLNYFLVPLYTYQFASPEYGVVTEMYAYVSFLSILLTYGMETALFRFSQTVEDKNKVYSTALISLLFSSLLFIAFATSFSRPIASMLNYSHHSEYVSWFALIIGLDAISAVPFAKLREQNKATRFAFIKSMNIAINIAFNLFFIVFCKSVHQSPDSPFYSFVETFYNPEIGIGYIFISNLIASPITVLLLLPEILYRTKYVFDVRLWKNMLVYALPLMIVGFAGMINETMDRALLKYLVPAEMNPMAQLGIYGACYKISILMTIFIQTFRFAAEPFFFSHSKEQDSKKLYADVMNYFVIACSFIFIGTMANMELIQYFIGAEYRQGLAVVPILLLANLCLGIYFNLSIWYKLTGQTKFGAYISLFGAAITLALNFYWIPRIGYIGSAWATLICYASMMALSYRIGQKYYHVNYDLKRIWGYLSLSLALYFISRLISVDSKILNLGLNNLLVLIFVAAVYFKEIYNGKTER